MSWFKRKQARMLGASKHGQMRRLVARGETTSDAVSQVATVEEGPKARLDSWRNLEANRLGMTGELWELLQSPDVTDVVINNTDAFADFGVGLAQADVGVETAEDTRSLAIRMAAAAGRRLDDASPIVDAVLPGPLRLHAVLPPIAQGGAAISLRVLRPKPFTLEQLVEGGTVPKDVAQILRAAVTRKQSVLITGATGAGKTTLLATLLGLIDATSRIVVIEEVTELALDHPHVVSLQSRPANIEGEGGVQLEELVRAAMRMRPDRLVLGECRGPEVTDVLTAFNTGHSGGFVTLHANSVGDVPARLLALGTLGGLDRQTVAALASAAFDMVVHIARDPKGARRVVGIGRFRLEEDTLQAHQIWPTQG